MIYYLLFIVEFIALFFLSRLFSQSLSKLFFRLTKSTKATIYLLSILFFPGTVIHELAHMFTAIILFVPVGSINIFPSFEKSPPSLAKSDSARQGEVKLGSVEIGKTDPVRRAIIGFGPVFAGLVIMLSILWQFFSPESSVLEQPLWKIVLAIYILFEIGNTMFSSKKDLEGTLELLGTIVIIVLLFYIVGFRVPLEVTEKLFSAQVLEFIKTVNLLLLAPIGVNLLGWGVTKALNK